MIHSLKGLKGRGFVTLISSAALTRTVLSQHTLSAVVNCVSIGPQTGPSGHEPETLKQEEIDRQTDRQANFLEADFLTHFVSWTVG